MITPSHTSHQSKCTPVLDNIRDLYRRLKTVFADGAYGKAGLPSHVNPTYSREKCEKTEPTRDFQRLVGISNQLHAQGRSRDG
jgi:hypothetical protein